MPKKWSTKNLTIVREPADGTEGIGIFEFTDDYSIFHYGKMPDQIPGKGEALCRMAAANFEMLEAHGIETHFRRFIAPNRIEFRLLRVLDPAHGQLYRGAHNCLIPLQIIFRNSLPPGSSVFRRLQSNEISLASLGLSHMPQQGETLISPVIEFTTKLEEIDRFVAESEAKEIACLSDEQMLRAKELVLKIDDLLTRHAASVGLSHGDGKIELGISANGSIIMVDATGTADENRFLLGDFHVGKQVLRDYYAKVDLGAKVRHWAATQVPRDEWPRLEKAPPTLLSPVADMYRALTERWTGDVIWGGASVEETIAAVRSVQATL
jgi:phosphoribosylaminoimidazole-succinocarboxamide synthase